MEDFRNKPGSPGDVLEHVGVKGMRWGIRKKEEPAGQDSAGTPLIALSAKKQAKVDNFLKRSDIAQTRISDLKVENEALKGAQVKGLRKLNNRYEQSINRDLIKQTEKDRKRALKDAEAVQKGKMTSKQKKVVAGAVVVTAIVGYGLYARGQQSGALNSYKLMGQARLAGRKVPFNVNKELSGKMSASELLSKVAKPVNPGYSKAGGKMNCRRSTYAYELRRRGFDVHATTSAVGWGQSESGVINALTTSGKDYFKSTSMSNVVVQTGGSNVAKGDKRIAPGAKILLEGLHNTEKPDISGLMRGIARGKAPTGITQSSSTKVLAELAKQPNGARGEVLFKFPSFGHSMAYEVVNGVPHIFDSQKGKLYDASTRVESHWDGFSGAEIRRLDNLNLDLNFLTRWADNV